MLFRSNEKSGIYDPMEYRKPERAGPGSPREWTQYKTGGPMGDIQSPDTTSWPKDARPVITRSEERRVGKACISRWSPSHSKKKKKEKREN